ncbi:T-complex protein 1 subunit theta-like isoform X2 [Rhinoderma darwinii]
MAAHVPDPPVILQVLRSGTRVFSSLEECALRHASVLATLGRCLSSCYGPAGNSKLLVTRQGKTLVSGSARKVLQELEIEHPAGILVRQACQTQDGECGDGTTSVLLLAAALMSEGETLLRAGMPATDLCHGYRVACTHACQHLTAQSFCPWTTSKTDGTKTSVGDVPGHEYHLLQYSLSNMASSALTSPLLKVTAIQKLVEQARSIPLDDDPENLQVLGFPAGDLDDSYVIKGAVLPIEPFGNIRTVDNARLALYMCPFGERRTIAPGTARIQRAEELEELNASKERVEEQRVAALCHAEVTVVAVAGPMSELALHFCNRARILVAKLERRSQVRQLVLATGAQVLTTDQQVPEYEELGQCQRVYPSDVGGQPILVFESSPQVGRGLLTVVVRAATPDLVEASREAITSAVKCYRAMGRDPKMVHGAGAAEMELSLQLERLGQGHEGLEQHGFLAYSRALQALPRILARNWGLEEMKVVAELRRRHEAGETNMGISEDGVVITEVLDTLTVKRRSLELATNVAITLISCGQVIVEKKSGGPRFRKENPNWDLEPDLVD